MPNDQQFPPPPDDLGSTPTNQSFGALPPQRQYDGPAPQAYFPPLAPGPDVTPTRPLRSTGTATATKPRGVSRRAVLIGAGAGVVGLGAAGAGLGAVVAHLRNGGASDIFSSDAGKINHLLRRAGFGPSPADIGVYLAAGVAGSVDRLVNYTSIADTLEQRLAALKFDFSKAEDMIRWFTLRMIYSQRPLEEKMTLFWSGVLTSSFRKIGTKVNYPLLIQQNQLLRTMGMGRFDDLIHAIAIDPAMLYWLDGRVSTGKAPNENFSRELMELFTLGIGNYTQDDVHQGALALTGWAVRGGKGVLVPARQYHGTVTYLGKTGTLGLDDVVQLVCSHPSTASHLAFRMWSFFVYDNPSASDLKPLVDAYNTSNHSIRAMVQAMFTAPAFFSEKAYRARVKSPAEFVAGAMRGLGLETDGTGLSVEMAEMGQVLFDPPNVSGWDGDKVSSNWLSTQAWMTRVNFTNLVVAAASGVPVGAGGAKTQGGLSATAIEQSVLQKTITARQLHQPQDLSNYYVAALLDNTLGSDRQAVLHDALAGGTSSEPALTLAGGSHMPASAARTVLYLLMSMPEYQMN